MKSGVEKVQGSIGKPEDIAAALCFLASAEARFVTGTTLIVNGEWLRCAGNIDSRSKTE